MDILNFTAVEILVKPYWIVLLVILISTRYIPWDKLENDDHYYYIPEKKALWAIAGLMVIITGVSPVVGRLLGWQSIITPPNQTAEFTIDGKIYSDYSLLTKSDGNYYFYRLKKKSDGSLTFNTPDIKIVKADEIKEVDLH